MYMYMYLITVLGGELFLCAELFLKSLDFLRVGSSCLLQGGESLRQTLVRGSPGEEMGNISDTIVNI